MCKICYFLRLIRIWLLNYLVPIDWYFIKVQRFPHKCNDLFIFNATLVHTSTHNKLMSKQTYARKWNVMWKCVFARNRKRVSMHIRSEQLQQPCKYIEKTFALAMARRWFDSSRVTPWKRIGSSTCA